MAAEPVEAAELEHCHCHCHQYARTRAQATAHINTAMTQHSATSPAPAGATIPGPGRFELLFSIPRIQRNPLAYLFSCAQRYGDLVRFAAGEQIACFANSPTAIKRVLQDNHRNYTKNTIQYDQLAIVAGRGLLTSDGDEWLSHRRLMQPAFHARRIEAMAPAISHATNAMLAEWQTRRTASAWTQSALPGVVDVDAEMLRLTLHIAGLTLFSIDLSRDAPRLTQAILTALDHIVYRASNFLALPERIPTPRNRRFRAALNTLDAAVRELIDARRNPGSATDAQPADLLSALLNTIDADTGQQLDDRAIRDEVLTLLIAGHETTASALTWAWHLLATHPDAQEMLRREIAQVIGARAPQYADLPRLTYCRQVIEETLRLYPPAWLITRRAIEADELDGHPIPAGAIIIISPYTIHRHPAYWIDPDQFRPERFASERGDHPWPRSAYIPFGAGPRLCIGQNFGMVEAMLILAAIAQQIRFEPAPGQPADAVKIEPLVTLRPRVSGQHGLRLRACPV